MNIVDLWDNYWQQIIYIFLACIGFIFSLISFIRFRPSKDDVKLYIMRLIPRFIQLAESLFGAGNGPLKLKYVLEAISSLCVSKKTDFDEAYWSQVVEDFLATPQKKKGD